MTKTATPKKGVGRKRKGLDANEKFKAFQALKDAKQNGVDKIADDGVVIGGTAIHKSVYDAAVEKLAAYSPPIQLIGTSSGCHILGTGYVLGTSSGDVFGVPAEALLATTSAHWFGHEAHTEQDDGLGTPVQRSRDAGPLGYLFVILLTAACVIVVLNQFGVFK